MGMVRSKSTSFTFLSIFFGSKFFSAIVPNSPGFNQVLFLTRFLGFFKLKSLSFMSSSNWGVIHSYFILLILNFLIGHKVSNIFLTIL